VQNRKEYLKHLLHEMKWKQEDRDWMLQYLNENDLTDLQEIAGDAYNAELFTAEPILAPEDSRRILDSIHQRLGLKQEAPVKMIWLRRWKVAVAALIILAAGIGYLGLLRKPVKQIIVKAEKERKTLTLPDGSMAYLEPGTTISYTEAFGKRTRELALAGEALFDVRTDDAHPFIVASSLIRTKVLGTSFNMTAWNLQRARVTVLTGMVQVAAKGSGEKENQVIVTANRSVVYNDSTHLLETTDATDDARFYLQKQQGRFVYDGIEIGKAVNDLQRFYNISITVDQRMQQCAFYGDVNTEEDLEKALNLIAVSLNAKITKDSSGNGYRIAGGDCQ
jgi:transmembrane sensor